MSHRIRKPGLDAVKTPLTHVDTEKKSQQRHRRYNGRKNFKRSRGSPAQNRLDQRLLDETTRDVESERYPDMGFVVSILRGLVNVTHLRRMKMFWLGHGTT
jgi:hypothetical protein